MISSIRLILIFITFLLILHEIISQEVKKNFRNYYKVISSKNLAKLDKQFEQVKELANHFDTHFSKNANEATKDLIEVHVTLNRSLSYKLIYENEHHQKSFVHMKVLNDTSMVIEGSEGHKKIIRQAPH